MLPPNRAETVGGLFSLDDGILPSNRAEGVEGLSSQEDGLAKRI